MDGRGLRDAIKRWSYATDSGYTQRFDGAGRVARSFVACSVLIGSLPVALAPTR